MNILVTIDANYMHPLKVMLHSLFSHHPEDSFCIYLMHSSLTNDETNTLSDYIESHGHELQVITLENHHFADAPVIKHFSKEMYYRLLAYKFLPNSLDRVLYLDPDILIINSVHDLYQMDMANYLYAAAYHDRTPITNINKLRLRPYDVEAYYNSGVLLLNLTEQRKHIYEQAIYEFVEVNKKKLILPDQDILNGLYAKQIKDIDEVRYNFDARFYYYYKITSKNKIDMDFVINNTSIIHFCGKKKPWYKTYYGSFHSLYKHYERFAMHEDGFIE
ncbi:glycosyltransferase family 8 protein [Virgibacillus sp. Bac330]|uniref:glycosyltransferase family 8 protein n=1 Tax=Virgibacillus sp. Bac330 TaxID=2419841 RepID=UPI000EF559B1|nr:glycosyltransferase family 8 protein [Virgibacillus sp. Bac330]